MTARLSAASLRGVAVGGQVVLPPMGWDSQSIGVVHLGIGAFHRAHQAAIAQDAFAATGDDRWGICGVTQRSADVVHQLRPQDGLYGVLERSAERSSLTVVGSVREVLFGAAESDRLARRIASPSVHVVSLTVTEKGYRRGADGRLDLSDPAVQADVRGGQPRTTVGTLVRGLESRAEGCGAPLTVLSCDNLAANGAVLSGLVADFCEAARLTDLARWVTDHVTFPSTMVDRIVPATSESDRATGERLLGLRDEGLVVAEPFRQWVIEDDFAGPRPPWEAGGARLVGDVSRFETLKLRVLNGAHSTLAYLGALHGHATIADAVRDPELFAIVEALIFQDVLPTLDPPPGEDLAAYAAAVLERFANPALAHRTTQIAADGSQKLPLRLLGTVRAGVAAGHVPRHALLGVAAWMTYLAAATGRGGLELVVEDPLAARLTALVRGVVDPEVVVDRLLAVRQVFGEDLPAAPEVREELVAAVRELLPR